MNGIYHLRPVYKSFIWGGRKLITEFHLNPELKNIGTIYSVIALPGHLDNVVEETGETLSEFYENHPELFRCKKGEFPVRMSITCNEGFQSYQLHPDDAYALAHENTWGKVSGSVTLKEDDQVSEKLFGNKAASLDEFKALVEKKDWESLFRKVKVKNGDFLHTPAGVIHGGYGDGSIYVAMGSNGDITYRFYDQDRNDPERPLHLQEVYDCVTIPEVDLNACVIHPTPVKKENLEILDYYSRPGEYIAKQLRVNGTAEFEMEEFYCLANVGDEGLVNGQPLKKGETILVEREHGSIQLEGTMRLMLISYED